MTSTPVPDQTTPPLLTVEDLFAEPALSAASISPDGTRLAFLAPAHGRLNVWVCGVDDPLEDATCVTHDARRGISSHYWTDDPRWLLYLQDTDGDEDWHLFRVDLDAPELPTVDLTPLPPGSRVFGVEQASWAPGAVLVSMNPRPAYIDHVLVDVATGTTTSHHEQDEPSATVLLDRDGRPAFGVRLEEDGTYEFSAVDAETGSSRVLTRLGGAEHPMGVQPQQVTPDGTGLLVGSYQDGDDLRLVRIDRATGTETVVAAVAGSDLDIRGTAGFGLPPTLLISRRTGEVVAARFVGDRPHLEVVDEHFADVVAALARLSDGVLADATSDESGQRWVATYTHDRDPAVTWYYDHTTGDSRRLSPAQPRLDPADLAPMTPVALTARDGLPLHAFLTLPLGQDPVDLPLVLLVHGGPWFHDAWCFDPAVQLLANRGYAVLQVNFRGSTGYGRRHTTSAVGEFARAMHTDLLDAVDWAVEHGYADPARVGIMGGSYGGYAALVAITVTPDRFAAAVEYVGISDLANFMRTLPPFTRPHLANSWFRYVGDPDDPASTDDMLARSPITMVDRIRTPLLVAQGANDPRVVQAESDNIVASLRGRAVPVEYLLAADEGHGFANHENRVRFYRAVERHFAEHL